MASSGSERKWSGRTGGGAFGQRFLVWFFKYVRVSFLYPVIYLTVPFYMIFGKGFGPVYRYFRQALHYGRVKSFFSTWRNHLLFGRIVLDKFALLSGKDCFKVEIEGMDVLDEVTDSEQGCMLAGSHIGNFELWAHLFKQKNVHVSALVYDGEGDYLQGQRRASMKEFNVELVSVEKDLSHIFTLREALGKGEFVSVACDRAFGSEKVFEVDFLGRKAGFPQGPFMLAASTGSSVVAIYMMKGRGLGYRGHAVRIDAPGNIDGIRERAEIMCREYVRVTEDIVRRYPLQWFNFYDFWN